jgi:hypothetical protein
LSVETHDQGGRTQATVAVTVTAADGLPATGAVSIDDQGRQLAGIALDGEGKASTVLELPGGSHSLSAVYAGDRNHQGSTSQPSNVQADSSSTPNFQVTVTPVPPATLPLVLTPGDAGTLTVTITPENNASLTSPMFVTVSCSGLPNQALCTFSPEEVEILQNTPASCASGAPASACPPTSTMVIQTQAAGTARSSPPVHRSKGTGSIAWALLLPGALGLGGLAWGARRRRWLCRMALVALVGLVTMLGTTACNPLYHYYNHGPPINLPTPAGTYTVTVTAQSTNGVTAITNSTTMVLTVK